MSKIQSGILIVLCTSTIALGLGYHPAEDLGANLENITGGFSPRPPDSTIVGIQWLHYENWFVTATVIAPNYIITAAHWNTMDSSDPKWPIGYRLKKMGTETLGGNEYIIVDARAPFNVRTPQGRVLKPDMMICRVKRVDPADPNCPPRTYALLEDANFPTWISFYESDGEAGQTITIGCFGRIETSAIDWCSLSEQQQQAIPQIRIAGTLHWGRNVLTRADKESVGFLFESPEQKGYVRYESYATFGNSGSPILIQSRNGWSLAGLFTSCIGGPRISRYIQWINQQLLDMEGYTVTPPANKKAP